MAASRAAIAEPEHEFEASNFEITTGFKEIDEQISKSTYFLRYYSMKMILDYILGPTILPETGTV